MRPTSLFVLVCVLSLPAGAQAPQGVAPPMKAPIGSAPAAAPAPTFVGPYRVTRWEDLVPPGWDPMKEFKDLNLGALDDADPRALQMMKRVREVWDNAPANPALEGKPVRIPGFVVPLEETPEGIKEFLLVPYFGACIHSPPPPANQIIHVLPMALAKGVRSMDAVWISGTLTRNKSDTYMGASSWHLDARAVEPYNDKR